MTTIGVAIPSVPPRAELLAKALASVTAQRRLPDAISVAVDHDHEGPAATRNRALWALETDWTAFLDDDDVLLPNHLEALVETAERTGADLVYPWFDVIGGRDVLARGGRPFDPDELRKNNYIPVTVLVRTKLAKDVGGFPPPCSEEWDAPDCEDWGFLLRLLDAGASFHHLPVITWKWRHHGRNFSGRTW